MSALSVGFPGRLKSGTTRLQVARLIECADEHVAAELTNGRQLNGKCLPAGGRSLVVREGDRAAVRKAVRRLGYGWPVLGE